MARAKRTGRAEARRRYRAQAIEGAATDLEQAATSDTTQVGPARPGSTAAEPTPRSGFAAIAYAFRAAIHPANVREDVAYLPQLIRHPAVWAPIAASAAIAAVTVVTGGRDGISVLLLPFFVWPPPQIGALFIAGFFAPRASYLAGLIVGVLISLIVAAAVAAAPASVTTGQPGISPSPSAGASATVQSPAPGASPAGSAGASPVGSPGGTSAASPSVTAGQSALPSATAAAASGQGSTGSGTQSPERLTAGDALAIGLGISPAAGVLLGSFSAWYRRFLRIASPNRGRPAARRQSRRR